MHFILIKHFLNHNENYLYLSPPYFNSGGQSYVSTKQTEHACFLYTHTRQHQSCLWKYA